MPCFSIQHSSFEILHSKFSSSSSALSPKTSSAYAIGADVETVPRARRARTLSQTCYDFAEVDPAHRMANERIPSTDHRGRSKAALFRRASARGAHLHPLEFAAARRTDGS